MMRTSIAALVAGLAMGSLGPRTIGFRRSKRSVKSDAIFTMSRALNRAPTSSHRRKWQWVSPSRQKGCAV
jgi:hypothetical protein